MDELSNEDNQDARRPSILPFLIGACLMLPWPILCIFLQEQAGPAGFLIYFFGAYFMLFAEPLFQLFEWISLNFSRFWGNIFSCFFVGLLILTWMTILFLPFFGSWSRKVTVLWITQFSYAAAQAICGWVFIDQRF